MAKGERNAGWAGFFRAFAVLCAIILILSQSGQAAGPSPGSLQALSVYEGLTCWAVPALFMLWGMSALEAGAPSLRLTFLRLALPAFCQLVFWGALYAVISRLLAGGQLSWGGIWAALTAAARGSTYFHLWILYPLIGLYLIHPVIHRFTASAGQGEVGYLLAMCFLFASVLPVWSAFFPGSVTAVLLNRFGVHLFLGWLGCYVAGWYLSHYTIGRAAEFLLYILGILGLALTLTGHSLFGGGGLWRQYSAPNVLLTAAAFCALFRYVLGISEERSRRRAVQELGSYCVGIYLLHQVWVLVFRWLPPMLPVLAPVLSVPLFAVVYFLLSAPFVWLFSRIPGLGSCFT